MKLFTILLVSTILFSLSSCEKKVKIDPKFDDSLYEKVDDKFYKGKTDGKFYIKTGVLEKSKDSLNKLVYIYKQVPDIDPPSFNKLPYSGYYAKDKNHVYICNNGSSGEEITILDGANPNSFISIGFLWGKDTNAVYYENKIVKGLDPANLVVVCMQEEDSTNMYIEYIRDEDQLFYHETEIKVPQGIDIHKLSCREDLFGNPFLSFGDHLYIIRNDSMVLHQ